MPGVDPTKSDSIGTDAKDTPLLCCSLGEAEDSRFSGSIVYLADIAVETCNRGHVDDGSIFKSFRL